MGEEGKFFDFACTELGEFDVEFHRSSIHLKTDIGTIIVKKKALSQLLGFLGVKRKEFKEMSEDEKLAVLTKLKDRNDIVISVIEIAPETYYAFRVTSKEYVAVPHRVLFEYVKSVLREAGVDVEPEVVRYAKRTVAYFKLFELPLESAKVKDVIEVALAVSNANTGYHSIKVYGYIKILSCRNGLIVRELMSRVRIFHTVDIQTVLKKVGDAVKKLLKEIKEKCPKLVGKLSTLEEFELEDWMIKTWLQVMKEKMPKKYHKWFEEVLNENVEKYGKNLAALFQTVTYMAPRVAKKNEQLSARLYTVANKIIENPEAYVKAFRKQ